MPELGARLGQVKSSLRRALPALIVLAVTTLVAAGSYLGYRFITTSDRFAVRVIEVRGNAQVSVEEIKARMGVVPGDNIFGVELSAMARALEAEPMIERALVRRRLPDTLIIEIEEREPAVLVELGGLYLADREGQVFKRALIERGDGAGLPVITGLGRAEYAEDPEAVAARIREALAAAATYAGSAAATRPALGEINIHPRHGITFTTYERAVAVRVGHGDMDALSGRLEAFDAAWQALSDEERDRARIVYANATTQSDRVTIGFEHSEQSN